MRNRLEIARELLSDTGSIYVHLDQNESHYCKILMDEIFGRQNFIREIIWNRGNPSGGKAAAQNWIHAHDNILFYAKSKETRTFNKLYEPYSEEYIDKRFIHKDAKGRYRLQGSDDRKQYLDESKGRAITSVWDIPNINVMAKEKQEFDGQKPEVLLQRILESSTEEGNIVLDYQAGTGTTGAVAHKMGRQYILIEQMDYIHDLPEARLKAVIAGDRSGISKSVGWKGGGGFVYTELMPLNDKFIREIEGAKTKKEILQIWDAIQKNGFVSYRVDPKQFAANAREFADLDLANQKKFILESLDMNMLCVNYGDIGDKEYGIGEDDKKMNGEFYKDALPRI
jgi:adenine-specific DNA-methyltransferase